MTIQIIDYGSGNLHSVLKAFQKQGEAHGLKAELTQDADTLASASHIVLPGVGAFGDCVAGLNALDGMREALEEAALQKGTPFFGICVGMQMMLERGLENGSHEGLGWIKGEVVPLHFDEAPTLLRANATARGARTHERENDNCQEPAKAARPFDRSLSERQTVGEKLRIPHMGWNTLTPTRTHPLFDGLGQNPHVYFVHSYHAQCANEADLLATTDYGGAITACIGRDNLLGTQFHPEKSGEVGLALIDHFLAGRLAA